MGKPEKTESVDLKEEPNEAGALTSYMVSLSIIHQILRC